MNWNARPAAILLLLLLSVGCSWEGEDWVLRGDPPSGTLQEGPFHTAVGGSQSFHVRNADGGPVKHVHATSLHGIFRIDYDPENDRFTLRALRSGTDHIRLDGPDGTAVVAVEAREAHRLTVLPKIDTIGGRVDEDTPWTVFGGESFYHARLYDRDGNLLVDDTLELSAKGGPGVAWDVFVLDLDPSDTSITARGYEGLEQPSEVVLTLDEIRHGQGETALVAGVGELTCFEAYKDGKRVWNVPWEVDKSANLDLSLGFKSAFTSTFSDCTYIKAEEAGEGQFTISAGGESLSLDFTIGDPP